MCMLSGNVLPRVCIARAAVYSHWYSVSCFQLSNLLAMVIYKKKELIYKLLFFVNNHSAHTMST